MAHRGRANADEALIGALAAGRTVREACRKAKVAERTAYRRLEDADFRRRITEARGEMVARALGRMADNMTKAAETLRKLLSADSDSVKLGAARTLLELGTRLRESVELESRVAALELRKSGGAGAGGEGEQ